MNWIHNQQNEIIGYRFSDYYYFFPKPYTLKEAQDWYANKRFNEMKQERTDDQSTTS